MSIGEAKVYIRFPLRCRKGEMWLCANAPVSLEDLDMAGKIIDLSKGTFPRSWTSWNIARARYKKSIPAGCQGE